jgi:hypothetical protein
VVVGSTELNAAAICSGVFFYSNPTPVKNERYAILISLVLSN